MLAGVRAGEQASTEKVENTNAEGTGAQGEPEESEPNNTPVTLVASVAPVDEASHTADEGYKSEDEVETKTNEAATATSAQEEYEKM